MIAFIQPVGIQGPAGAPKLLRGLLQTGHPEVLSINTGCEPAPEGNLAREIYLPQRRHFGRIEFTRFYRYFNWFDAAYAPYFKKRLKEIFLENDIKLIHLIPHDYTVVTVHQVAKELGIPLILNVQDDIEYTNQSHPLLKKTCRSLAAAWHDAANIFAISEAIGKEYCRRYGRREYQIVTDGLTQVAAGVQRRPETSLRIYFMGLFHQAYGANMRAMLDALKNLRDLHPEWTISVISRSKMIACSLKQDDVPVRVLGFAPSENVVEKDMQEVDFLYQPLPMTGKGLSLSRYSMSTKMVSYLGSGLPIFFHGPESAAAGQLLRENDAAVICNSLEPEVIAAKLESGMKKREKIVENALMLAQKQFMLVDQQNRFWKTINEAMVR